MRSIINYIRSCFCKHDWELISKTRVFDRGYDCEMPYEHYSIYRCRKCGYVQKVKL